MAELPPLLRLPPTLRRRIYDFVGLASSDRLSPDKFDLHGRPVDAPALPPSRFHGLLLSCRTIHAETAAIVYSSNLFVLRYDPSHPEPLRPLQALTPTALASLTSLTVVLNQASCHQHCGFADYGFCCVEGRDSDSSGLGRCKSFHTDSDSHQPPLLAPRPGCPGDAPDGDFAAVQRLLAHWRLAAACLSPIPAGRLELALVCDSDPHHERAREVASLVTAPLRLLPRLKDCRIRLSKTPDAALQQIAWHGVLQAHRVALPPYYSPKPSARTQATLLGLPRELRLRIFEYTDLVTPGRQVTWSRQDRGYLTIARKSYLEDDDVRLFYHCWTSSYSVPSFLGCFCRRRHAAFSLTCKCWAPPTPLFLICHTLCHDAQLTFFSLNRFIIHDYKASLPWHLPFFRESESQDPPEPPEGESYPPIYAYPHPRLAASHFLREIIPRHCLPHLRFLELVFPPYPAQTWPRGDDHPVLQDWQDTIEWLVDKVNAPALTLRLAGAGVSYDSPEEYRRIVSMKDGEEIWEAHLQLARPVRVLAGAGLGRFFVGFPFPWEFAIGVERKEEMRGRIEAGRERLKESLERMVLGGRYEGQYVDGREEPGVSFWVEQYDLL